MTLRLVEPVVKLEAEYRAVISELLAEGDTRGYVVHSDDMVDFAAYVQSLHDEAAGINLPAQWVPQSTFWLTDEADRVLGEIRLRHTLTPSLLQEGGNIGYMVRPSHRNRGYATFMVREVLKVARTMGISKVLLTCQFDNSASIRVIEKCGGLLDTQPMLDQDRHRYWIML